MSSAISLSLEVSKIFRLGTGLKGILAKPIRTYGNLKFRKFLRIISQFDLHSCISILRRRPAPFSGLEKSYIGRQPDDFCDIIELVNSSSGLRPVTGRCLQKSDGDLTIFMKTFMSKSSGASVQAPIVMTVRSPGSNDFVNSFRRATIRQTYTFRV